jgi:transcriptional regulator with XRE-family HTH domain
MVDVTKLRQRVAESGYKLGHISRLLGLSRPSLTAKIRGKSEFSVSEVQRMAQILNLSPTEKEAIFFAEDVNYYSTGDRAHKALGVPVEEIGV